MTKTKTDKYRTDSHGFVQRFRKIMAKLMLQNDNFLAGKTHVFHVRKNGIIDIRDLFPCRPKFIK